ncbi:hypothetical protein MKEN_01352300 [Mycena kentingensis (nom. inval.)]|nr:hypothetical protein MKEN_01352300 [Mycena kentingensis (nom. inval.)]
MFALSSALVAFALAQSSFAALSVTSPTATIGFTAGQDSEITWKDDGSSPALSAYGPCKISIYAGNSAQQTSLQTIADNVDVTTGSLKFKPDASIGPNSDQYFIRFESNTVKDPSNAVIPLLAFSHQFTLSGMTGTFNAAVQAQIDGQSTAPIGGVAAQTSASAANTAANTAATVKASTTGSTKASASASKASSSVRASGTGAAVPLVAGSHRNLLVAVVTGVVGAVVGASLL